MESGGVSPRRPGNGRWANTAMMPFPLRFNARMLAQFIFMTRVHKCDIRCC